MQRTERNAYIALNMVPGTGAVSVRGMVEAFGSLVAAWDAGPSDWMRIPGVGPRVAESIRSAFHAADVETELARAADTGTVLVTLADAAYPKLLKTLHSPPLVLYVRGSVEALDTPCAAMVGTRAPTQYGREVARRFGFQLAQAGVTVVSGLARGIDTESHQAALRAKGRTIAVIGSALDELYPPENRGLAETIAASGGAVISEYPFGRRPDRQTFPMRNRIVSGLSRAVLVVEAGVTSGTLITARHALEQGRSVLAVPGRIDNPEALGCHRLLKQGARLAECLDDVLEEMRTLRGFGPVTGQTAPSAPRQMSLGLGGTVPGTPAPQPPAPPPPAVAAPPADPMESALLEALREAGGETDVETLLARTGLPAHKVSAKLISLEMKRRVRQLPGRRVALRKD